MVTGELGKLYVGIVDDDERLRRSLARLLRAAGMQPITYASAEDFSADVKQPRFDCHVLDVQLPGINYNLGEGLYLTSGPLITVDWKAESSQRWTVPLGGGVGKIFHLGKLLVNTQLTAYYNVVKPDDGPNWQIRAQVQFMFPK